MSIQHMARPLAIKSLAGDGTFFGYASVFDAVDSHNESVTPGAFRATLAAWSRKDGAPAMLWMHDPTTPIGVWIGMAEDQRGLAVHGRLALGTQKGREAYELMKMKALTGLSIGYRVRGSRIDVKRRIRLLTEVDLFEVSLVTFPSNDKARVLRVKAPSQPPRTGQARDRAKTQAAVAPLRRASRALKTTSQKRRK